MLKSEQDVKYVNKEWTIYKVLKTLIKQQNSNAGKICYLKCVTIER